MSLTSPDRILLIDAGNSRLKWALSTAGTLSETGSASYQWQELEEQLSQCWAHFTAPDKIPNRILMANVAGPQLANAVVQWANTLHREDTPNLKVDTVIPQARAYGVINAYTHPERLGVDRWAALVAARHYIQGAVCVVDCGTALTVDILSAPGHHQGGIIVPGIKLMKQSLVDNTDAIHSGQGQSANYLGRDTQSAIQAGVIAAASGAVTQVLQQARAELGEPLVSVITGGDALQLLAALPGEFRHEPDWVLKGLAVIAEAEQ